MAGKKPFIRRNSKFGHDKALAKISAIGIDFCDSIEHQHGLVGQSGVARAEQFASRASEEFLFGVGGLWGKAHNMWRENMARLDPKIDPSQAGFTLLEVLSVLGIIAILLGAHSIFFSYSKNYLAILESRSTLRASLDASRYLAVQNRTLITLCNLDSQNACDGQWQNGWTSFIDTNRNKQKESNELEVFAYTPKNESLAPNLRAFPLSTSKGFTFNHIGGTFNNGTFSWNYKDQTIKLIINRQGRMRYE